MGNKKYIVYMHKNKINGKVYIGITCLSLNDRWRNGRGYKSCKLFYKAILKYGWDNFEHLILYKNLNKEEAEKTEIKLIKQYNSNNKNYGYNICSGGNGTPQHKMSKESKEKMIKKLKKIMNTPEMKKRISETHSGKNHINYGKHLSEETKKKISETEKGKHKKGKKVMCIETNKIYESITQASKKTNINAYCIGQVCLNKRKSAGKLHWKYIN